MGDLKIWKYVGCVSAISGLACFPLSSTYKMSFGKLGIGGLLSYLLVCLITGCLILLARRNQVPDKAKGVVGAILLVVINSISVVHDKYVPGKSDAFTIISYGSFALMSVSLSRKLELGFETGFSAFFLQLFTTQLFKIKWFLLPIALVFSSLVIILRHYPEESEVQEPGSSTPNNDSNPIEVVPPNANATSIRNGEEDIIFDKERQDSPEMGEVSRQRQLSTNNEQNSQEESSQAIGEVSEENISDVGNELNSNQEEDGTRPSLAAASSHSPEQDHVSIEIPDELHCTSRQPLRVRMGRMTRAIQNIPSSLGDTLRRWHQYAIAPAQNGDRRRRSQSGSPNGGRPQEAVPQINAPAPVIDNYAYSDFEVQYSSGVGELEVSGESLSSSNNEQNNQEESSEAAHHSSINYGQVSEGNISDGGKKEEGSSSSSDNDLVDRCASPQPPRVKRRRRMTHAIRNISSHLGHALRRWHPARLRFSKKSALKNKME